nr:GNAT family N-acetyltransferase [Halobaculum sp. SYNS20]
MDDVETVADLWVRLADGQRSHGTHLAAAENRPAAADAAARAVVTGGLVVARASAPDPDESGADAGLPDEGSRGVVGFVTFGIESGRYDLDVTRGAVYNLFVREGYRDGGVGAELLAAAESALADEGVDVVALEAMAANRDARRFYERHGYDAHRIELEKPVDGDGSDSD